MHTILLIRHGRSSHVERGWQDHRSLARWQEAYDLAGISDDSPPAALCERVRDANVIVASDARRARESAARLAESREVLHSPLLREATLVFPRCGGLRLPMPLWGLIIGLRWAWGRRRGDPLMTADAARAIEAAAWLASLARQHGTVAAVTHGAMRRLIADALVASGWRLASRKGWEEWGFWSLT